MEGGKIIRTIGGESVKIAKKSITLTATEGDLTFNSATKVMMTGKQGVYNILIIINHLYLYKW